MRCTRSILTRDILLSATLSVFVACGSGTGPSSGPPPTLSRVEPATGTVGTELRIEGSNFRAGARVFLGDLEADFPEVTSSSVLFAFVPSGVPVDTPLDVVVRNSDATEAEALAAFTAVVPNLAFMNGATRPSGNLGSTVVLEGEAFGDLRGTGQALFSDGAGGTVPAAITTEDDWTDTFILTTVPSGAATGDVVVQTATGTSDPISFTVTQEATFSPSVVDWRQTTSLPAPVSGHAALFLLAEDGSGQDLQRVYVVGGADGAGSGGTNVWFGAVGSDGTVAAWDATAGLPAGRAYHAVLAATPFNSRVNGDGWIYVLGGVASTGDVPLATIYRAPLMSDGTVGSWIEIGALPEPLHSQKAVIFQSRIYIVGGATTGDAPSASVHRAAVDTLGNLGTWEQLTSLPSVRARHAVTLIGNCLHVVGGDNLAVSPGDPALTSARYDVIHRARIDLRSREISAAGWTLDDTKTVKARRSHTSVIAGGGMLNTAGLYEGIGNFGSSENMFSQIDADCEVAGFNGANNQNSIKKNGGANLFDHAAVSFVDASGTAHVMILGGDAADQAGQKQDGVWVY